MTIEQMRAEMLKVYPSDRWKRKVKTMSPGQVFVVYTRLRNAKKI